MYSAKSILVLAASLAASTVFSQNKNLSPEKAVASFPEAAAGQHKVVLSLPAKGDAQEKNLKIELIAGKNMTVDCNSTGLNGKIETKTNNSGYSYYEFVTNGQAWSTQMGCPDNSVHKDFVAAQPLMIDYSSRIPVVVYLPADYDVKYRTWTAGEIKEIPETQTQTYDSLYQNWNWQSSKGGYGGRNVTAEKAGVAREYRFRKDGTYEVFKKGKKVSTGKYTIKTGKSIFSETEVPIIQLQGNDKSMSVRFKEAKTMVLTEECYDCYEHQYIRSSK